MSIDGIKGILGSIPSVKPLVTGSEGVEAPKSGSFANALKDALSEVGKLQTEADGKIAGMMEGKPGITPHEAMIALEKADVAFTLMTTIKAKIVQAYQEVLRTQV